MNDALARIYALQQREINDKERQRQQQIAKQQRLIAAFNATGILAVFNEFRNLPLRPEVRQRVYKATVKELAWQADMPDNRLHDMSFVAVNGSSNGPRWWCEESAETGQIRYLYTSGASYDKGTAFHTPQGEWLDRFIQYLAAAADTNAISEKLRNSDPTTVDTPQPRRQLQPI